MKKWIACLLLLPLLLAACSLAQGAGPAEEPEEPEKPERTETPGPEPDPETAPEPGPESTTEPTPEPSPEPDPEPSPEPSPEPTPVTELLFPDGSTHTPEETELDLSWLRHREVPEAAELLRQMPELRHVELGADNARSAEEANILASQEAAATGQPKPTPLPSPDKSQPERLTWADIRLLQESAPQAEFYYRFRFYGRDFSLQDETMDLNHRTMTDEGAGVREILPCMKHLNYLDMDFCGVSDEAMAAIRADYPQVEVVWRIWFGKDDKLSVRTDTERILASDGGMHVEENISGLQYCTKVKYLDLGHMPDLEDWSFLGCMPDLRVVIITLGGFTGDDLAGLANCPHLEYLEMCSRSIRGDPLDLSFLAELHELRHLNICANHEVVGYEALANLTGLERLWIGTRTYIPADYIEYLREALPDTDINDTTAIGDGPEWRFTDSSQRHLHPRYAQLREEFDYDHYDKVCSLYWNDPLYKPHD